MKGAPWFKFHVADFLGGTAEMTTGETGAYIRLLCHQWNAGSIPDDLERLAVMAGGLVSDLVKSKFEAGNDGRLRNVRLESHREEAGARSQMAVVKAAKSWERRKHAVADAAAYAVAGAGAMQGHMPQHKPQHMPGHMQSIEVRGKREENIIKQPFLSGKPDDTRTLEKSTRREEFETAWKTYPNKSGSKEKAFRAFAKFSDPLTDVLAGIARYVQHVADRRATDFPDLQYQNGQTFFNGRGWTSEWVTNAHKTAAKEAKPLSVWEAKARIEELTAIRDSLHSAAFENDAGRAENPKRYADYLAVNAEIQALRAKIAGQK